jgi:membrane peptidoglycan carboxypeptidase
MPATIPIIQRRRERRLLARQQASRRVIGGSVGCGMILSLLLGFAIFALAFAYVDVTRDLPSLDLLPALLDADGVLRTPSHILDRTGEHVLLTLAPDGIDRRYVTIDPTVPEHLPPSLVAASVAETDPDFWAHGGYVLDGLARPDEHPTIAQKLAADLLLWREPPSLRRAIRERILAAQMTDRFGRNQILEWYLNSVNYGRYAYGADAAAQYYFGKPVSKLNLAESALLAGVSKTPALNPFDAPQAALQIQQETLALMELLLLEPPDQINQARAFQPVFQTPRAETNLAPAFTALALSQLGERSDRDRFERGGMDLITTLDYDLQMQSACMLETYLTQLNGETREIKTHAGSTCIGARLLALPQPGSSAQNLAASAAILDPHTGQILALVGEIRSGHETASLAPHRAGTLLTPFIYLTGFTRGLSPATMLWDIPGGLASDIPIQNFDSKYHGPVRARVALVNDYLVPTQQTLNQMGADAVRKTAQAFGLTLSSADMLSGENRLSLLSLAHAYAGFAMQGQLNGQPGPYALLSLTSDHLPLDDWSASQARQVVTPQLAYLITNALGDPSVRTSALGDPAALEIGRPSAAKVGRSLDSLDAWTAGYTPRRVVVVWVGADQPVAPRLAADAWYALMQYASRGVPGDGWDLPKGVTKINVCDPSGLLPTSACPNVVSEVFLDGNAPMHLDNLYQTFDVNRETNLLATVFTPAQLIEPRVYMVVPLEARAWADQFGLPVPPETYDSIQSPPPSPDVRITSPQMFTDLRGKVTITGSAAGADFLYYRLQAGQGLNPQAWIQIGANVDQPVPDGALAEWDTSALNGLYALQLIVVRKDQRVETATIQVSLDNSAPQIDLIFPVNGAELSLAASPQIVFRPNVSDNLSLARVDFILDGKTLQSSVEGPYEMLWTATVGQHTLEIVAIDRVGNETRLKIAFTVKK